jgi:hypothetical protein
MRWGKRVLGATVAVLGAVVLVLCLAGIGGAWMFRGRAIPAVAEAGTSATETLAAADEAVGRFRQKVAKVRTAVTIIEREARRLAAVAPDEFAAAPLTQGNDQVIEYLKPAMSVANSLELVAGALDKGLARWQAAQSGQLEIDRLRSAIRGLAETATALEQAKSGLIEQTPAAAARFAEELWAVDARLENVENSLRDFAADLDDAQTSVADMAAAAPRWITLAAWAATLVLGWFALSQVSLLLHGWSLVRNDT